MHGAPSRAAECLMVDESELPTSLPERVAMMEGILIASATGRSGDTYIYEHLRREFMQSDEIIIIGQPAKRSCIHWA
jgi:hypothetical protein